MVSIHSRNLIKILRFFSRKYPFCVSGTTLMTLFFGELECSYSSGTALRWTNSWTTDTNKILPTVQGASEAHILTYVLTVRTQSDSIQKKDTFSYSRELKKYKSVKIRWDRSSQYSPVHTLHVTEGKHRCENCRSIVGTDSRDARVHRHCGLCALKRTEQKLYAKKKKNNNF
jgi:hypothetical protein